jgi:hypothetical protein
VEVTVVFDTPLDLFDRFTKSDFKYIEKRVSQVIRESLSIVLTSIYISDNGKQPYNER